MQTYENLLQLQAFPQHLLTMISSGCKKGCGNACSCRKIELKCSQVFRHFSDASRDNAPDVAVEIENCSEGDDLPDVDIEVLLAQDVNDTSLLPDKAMTSRYDNPYFGRTSTEHFKAKST